MLNENEIETFDGAYNYARLFIRTAGTSPILSDQILALLAKCPEGSQTLCLYGQYYLIQQNAKKAQEYFNRAMSQDSTMVAAFIGLVWCCIKLGNRKRATQQFEMARTMFDTTGVAKVVDLYLLEIHLGNGDNKADLLKQAQLEHTKQLATKEFDLRYLEDLNPLMCLDLFDEYLTLLDKDEMKTETKPSPNIRRCERLITLLRRSCSNLQSVRIAEAQFKMITGKFDEAEEILHTLDPTADIYLLQGALEIERKNTRNARRFLDSAIATEFNVQNTSKYQFLSAQCSLLNANYPEAIAQFERALKGNTLNQSDLITANLRLAEAYQKNGQYVEAARVTDDIERNYSDASSIAGRLALSKAEQALQAGEVAGAISVLENVKYNSAAAMPAKHKLAEIYLNDRRNEDRFIEIYREMCQHRPGEFEPLVALGDALIRVNRTEDGIKSYEAGLRLKKTDCALQVKIGQAMVITHDYGGAIKYYRKSVQNGENATLRIDLADLLKKLGAEDDAIAVLTEGTTHQDNTVASREVQARCFYELCKIKADRGQRDDALQLLAKAKQITDQIMKKKEQSDDTESIKILNTDVHIMIGELAQQNGDYDNATKFYSKATTFLPNSMTANQCRLKLANAYRLKGDHSHAQGKWLKDNFNIDFLVNSKTEIINYTSTF